MKTCIGKPIGGDPAYSLANIPHWHGKYGHINVITMDHDSIITRYGQHDRVVGVFPAPDGYAGRIDLVWGLGIPTNSQILDCLQAERYISKDSSWEVERLEQWDNGQSLDIYIKRKANK